MSFWSSLASGFTSLIPGVGPFIAPLAGAAVGALTGGSGNSAGGNSVKLNPQASSALGPAKSYFTEALNGDQSTLQGLLDPQISTVLAQYDNAAKTAANLGPRGGGRTAVLANAPFQKAGAYGQALSGARTGAAKTLGELGIQEQGENNRLAQAQGELNLGQNKLEQGAYQFKQGQLGELGKGLGGILTNVLTGKKAGGSSLFPVSFGNDSSVASGEVD